MRDDAEEKNRNERRCRGENKNERICRREKIKMREDAEEREKK